MADSNSGILNSILGGAGSVLGAGINTIAQGIMGSKQRKFQREERIAAQEYQTAEREAAQQFNVDMWNMNNEYNSASSQMQRMVDAGINPNNAASAVAGTNASSSPVSTQGQSGVMGSAPSVPTPAGDFSHALSSFFDPQYRLLDAQERLINAQIEREKASASNLGADTENKKITSQMLGVELQGALYDLDFLKPAEVRKTMAEADKILADKVFTEEETKQVKEQTLNYIKAREQMDADIRETEQNINLIKEKMKTEQSTQALNASQADLSREEAKLAQSKTERQELQNRYEELLQNAGTSIDSHSNMWVNERDQLSVLGQVNGTVNNGNTGNSVLGNNIVSFDGLKNDWNQFGSDWKNKGAVSSVTGKLGRDVRKSISQRNAQRKKLSSYGW